MNTSQQTARPSAAESATAYALRTAIDVCGRRGGGGCSPVNDMAIELPGQSIRRALKSSPTLAPTLSRGVN